VVNCLWNNGFDVLAPSVPGFALGSDLAADSFEVKFVQVENHLTPVAEQSQADAVARFELNNDRSRVVHEFAGRFSADRFEQRDHSSPSSFFLSLWVLLMFGR
jgi:hypothetical protein